VRHPLAVSYATQKWSKSTIPDLVKHWVAGHQIMQRDLPFIRNKILLRYEDFVDRPQDILNDIYQILKFKSSSYNEAIETGSNQYYFDLWEAAIKKDHKLLKEIELLCNIPHQVGYHFVPPYTHSYS
jgi:hypothetical protein